MAVGNGLCGASVQLDPVEWGKELERVGSKLAGHRNGFAGKGSVYSDWRDRLKNFRTASQTISSSQSHMSLH